MLLRQDRVDIEDQGRDAAPLCPIPARQWAAQALGLWERCPSPRPGCSRVTGDLERPCCGGCVSHGPRAQHCPGSLPRAGLFMRSAPTVPIQCCRGKEQLGSASPHPSRV